MLTLCQDRIVRLYCVSFEADKPQHKRFQYNVDTSSTHNTTPSEVTCVQGSQPSRPRRLRCAGTLGSQPRPASHAHLSVSRPQSVGLARPSRLCTQCMLAASGCTSACAPQGAPQPHSGPIGTHTLTLTLLTRRMGRHRWRSPPGRLCPCRRLRPRAQGSPPPKKAPRGPETPRATARPWCHPVRGATPCPRC